MLDVYCPRHGATVLLWPSNIEVVSNGDSDVIVGWRCHCGQIGSTHVPRRGRTSDLV